MQKSKLQFKIKNHLGLFAVAILFLSITNSVSAAILYFDSSYHDFYVGDQFEADLMLNTENQSINALEGKVILSQNLKLQQIIDGDSIINLWLQKPAVNSQNEISFSGIVPGGFTGELNSQVKGLLPGVIFRMIIFVEKPGEIKIDVQNARVLLNDGLATQANLSILTLNATTNQGTRTGPGTAIKQDKTPPEPFVPEISRSPDIFNNQSFVVFATQDKGYGIDHYEINEVSPLINDLPWLGKLIISRTFRPAESPYVLKDQTLKSYIYVKAVDKADNERIAVFSPQKALSWYESPLIWIIIIIIILGLYFKRKFLWGRKI